MATWYSRTWASGKISWYTKVPDAAGAWKPVLLKGIKSEPQAKKLALEMEKERERGGLGLPGATPFIGSFAELCAWAFKVHFSKQGSAQPDGSVLRKHAGDPAKGTATKLGALPVRQVTGAKLAEYFDELAETNTVRGKPYSANTINRIRSVFATVFEQAKERGHWIGPNPVHQTKEREGVTANFDILQAHETEPVLAATPDYWRGCLATGILAALRKGELFGLMKVDVNLAGRVLLVRRSHDRETTKGGEKAGVPISEDLVPYIEQWMQSPGPYLFPDAKGKRRSKNVNLPRILRAALLAAGFIDRWEYKCRRKGCGYRDALPAEETRDCPACGFRLWATPKARNIKWHEGTRHTLASHALMSGASLAGVQKILRHADPRLTINTYGHLSTGYLKAEVDRVSLLPGAKKIRTAAAAAALAAEPPAFAGIVPPPSATPRGARVVRGAPRGSRRSGFESTKRHETSGESEWSRGDLNPRPMHCEGIAEWSPVAPILSHPCQPGEISHPGPAAVSHPLPSGPTRPDSRGAPMVRRNGATHQGARSASAGGSGRPPHDPADLLTVKQVGERLQVGRMWVRRRLESGELTGIRLAPQSPLMISSSELNAYLKRFPGIVPTAPQEATADGPVEAPAPTAARASKGAA